MSRSIDAFTRVAALAVALATSVSAFAARPVARWDVVPFQRVSGVFKAGVVAFHEKGVSVRFIVNGKTVHTASKPELNDRTGVVEYVLPLATAKFPDGPLTIGALAIVEGEQSYRLPYIQLYANNKRSQGSSKTIWVDCKNGNEFSEGTKEAPVRSIKRGVELVGDGGTVYLKPGDYSAKMIGGGLSRKYWTTIQPAPGFRRSEVKIRGGRTGTEKLRFRLVELYCDVSDGFGKIIMGEKGETMAWFDGCRMYNRQGRWSGETEPFGNGLRAFVTGGETSAMSNGPAAELVRGHTIKNIAFDAFSGSDRLVVNSRVMDIDPGDMDGDPDFYRGLAREPDWIHDVILYNVSASDCKVRVMSGARMRDSAFVDLNVATSAGDDVHSYFSDLLDNILFVNVKISGQGLVWMQSKNGRTDVIPRDVRFFGCDIPAMSGFEPLDGSSGILVTGAVPAPFAQ